MNSDDKLEAALKANLRDHHFKVMLDETIRAKRKHELNRIKRDEYRREHKLPYEPFPMPFETEDDKENVAVAKMAVEAERIVTLEAGIDVEDAPTAEPSEEVGA